jgi:adhesin transport system outer membrane protein
MRFKTKQGMVGSAAVLVLALAVGGAVDALAQGSPDAPPPVAKAAGPAPAGVTEAGERFKAMVAEAVRRHPAINSANSVRAQRELDQDVAYADLMPQVDGGLDVIDHRASPPVVVGLADRRIDASMSVSQLIYDFGATFNRLDAAKSDVEAARLSAEGVSSSYILRAVENYFGVIRYRALEAATKRYVERMKVLSGFINERAAAGVGSEAEVVRGESRLSDALAQLTTASGRRERAEAQFNEIFGELPPQLELPHLELAVVENRKDDELISSAREQNPTLRRQKALTEGASHAAAAADEDLLPKLKLELDTTKYSIVGDQSPSYNYDFAVQLRVVYKLYSGGAETARARSVQERYSQQKFDFETADRELERDVRLSIADMRAAKQKIVSSELAHKADSEALVALMEQYKVGGVKFIEILDAERENFQSDAQLADGRIDVELSKYNVMALTGDLAPFFGLEH